MTQRPDPGQPGRWEPWLLALDAEIAAEEREDRRKGAEGLSAALPEPGRDIVCFEDFADHGVSARPSGTRPNR